MARTRWDYIQRKKAESGQTGTATYDLPEKGFMPNLTLTAFSTPTATTTPATPLSDAITKIEITDGGLVLKSLTGNQIKGLSMIHGHPCLGSAEINDNAAEGYDHFMIPMGGLYNETVYAPDMGRFNNPQIKITWDYTIVTTEFGMTTAADTTPSMKFSLLAELCSEGGGYTHGYTKSIILKEFTQSTSTNTIVELPRGDQLVGFGVEAGYDALDFTEDVEELKFDLGNGDWIPFHLREEEIMQFQQQIFKKPFEYSWIADIESADEFDFHMGYLNHVSILSQRVGDDAAGTMAYAIEQGHKGVETLIATDTAAPTACDELRATMFKATGWAPFHLWYCPMKVINGGENDLLDTNAFGRLEVELLSGSSASSSSTPDVIAEYLRT